MLFDSWAGVWPEQELRRWCLEPARAIVAHLDTIGAMVRQLKPNGRLALAPIGTWSSRFAEGARVTIFTEKCTYRGTILPLKASGHVFHDDVDRQPVGWQHVELRVDEISNSRAELEALAIQVGDTIAIDPEPEINGGFVNSRHLDDKAGVAAVLAAAKALVSANPKLPLDCHLLFTIAEDLTQMELQVDIDEADVGKTQVGQEATFNVDAYPDRKFPARIRDIRFASETVQGVVTYKGLLTVDNSELLLRPGMTATAEIVTAERDDVLLVPNAALRFSPPSAENRPKQKGGGIVGSLLPRPPRQPPRTKAAPAAGNHPRRHRADPDRRREPVHHDQRGRGGHVRGLRLAGQGRRSRGGARRGDPDRLSHRSRAGGGRTA